MPKYGDRKVGICPHCGCRCKVIWELAAYWKGYCPKCGNLIKEGEGDVTKVEGQI